MHVCYLLPPIERYSPISGGALATCTMQQARRLIARGHQVSVLAGVVDEPYSIGTVYPVRVERRDTLNPAQRLISRALRGWNRWDWVYYEYYLHSFRKTLAKLSPRPDALVIFNDLQTPKYARQVLPDAKIVVRLSNEVRTQERALPAALSAVDTIVPVSSYIRDWTRETYGVPDERMVVLPNGADLESFYPRDDFLEPGSPVKVLFIGRLNHDKGPDLVADAVEVLQREGLPVALTVAGAVWWYGNENQLADPFVREMMAKIERTGATYLGHVPRSGVPELVRSHDVVCVLSRWKEPMAQVTFEAMASGCALLASDRGGLPEACGNGAILANPDDFDSVVGHLRRLVAEPEFLKTQKQQARARAQAATWDMNVDTLEHVLRS